MRALLAREVKIAYWTARHLIEAARVAVESARELLTAA